MEPGILRHEIDIQAHTETPADDGTVARSWANVATDWRAAVIPLRGKEYFEARQVKDTTTHRIRIRYYDGLTPKHRIIHDSRTFNIETVINVDELDHEMDVMCQEVL